MPSALPRLKKDSRVEFKVLEVWAILYNSEGTLSSAAGPEQSGKVSRGGGGGYRGLISKQHHRHRQ